MQELIPGLEIKQLLGSGGMGAVYLAHQAELGRDVALKILLQGINETDTLKRFQREAQVMANLGHSNIVTIHEFGSHEGIGYLIMEFIEGESLAQLLARETSLSVERSLSIASQIGDALEYAHSHNVIHRDLKPANIIVQQDGTIKVIDFGMAKFLRPPESVAAASNDLTRTGSILGTARYIAPEQYLGIDQTDQRSDIFSLGVILYEMLTGDVPGGRFNSPSKKSPQVPSWLDTIVLDMLGEKPDDRLPSAKTFKSALANGPALIEREHSQKKSTFFRYAIAITPLIVGAVFVFSYLTKDRSPPDLPKFVPTTHRTSLGSDMHSIPEANAFFATTEVTVADYQVFVSETKNGDPIPSMLSLSSDGGDPVWSDNNHSWREPGFSQQDDHPVTGVSYDDARAFCEWLTDRDSVELPEGMAYRLPTVAEWFAVTQPSQSESSPSANLAGGELQESEFWPQRSPVIDGFTDEHIRTAPVGSYLKNHYGLADTHGNVAEWASLNQAEHAKQQAVLGSSWSSADIKLSLKSENESRLPRSTRRSDIGFRFVLARDPTRLIIPPVLSPSIAESAEYVMHDNILEIDLCETTAYAPLFLANQGLSPNPDSDFFKKHGFMVRINLTESEDLAPFTAGKLGATVTTTEGLPAYGPAVGLVVPYAFGKSLMEDGFVVRSEMDSLDTVLGKTFMTAQLTLSEIFLRHLFTERGIPIYLRKNLADQARPDAVNLMFASQVDFAVEIFEHDLQHGRNEFMGCVGWPPFTTDVVAQSNGKAKIFRDAPDVWTTDILILNRPFAENNPGIVDALIEEIGEGAKLARAIQSAIDDGSAIDRYPRELEILATSVSPSDPWPIKEICEELKLFTYHSTSSSRDYLTGSEDLSLGTTGTFRSEYLRTIRALGLAEAKLTDANKFVFPSTEDSITP